MRSACSCVRPSALSRSLVKPARSRPSAAASSARIGLDRLHALRLFGFDRAEAHQQHAALGRIRRRRTVRRGRSPGRCSGWRGSSASVLLTGWRRRPSAVRLAPRRDHRRVARCRSRARPRRDRQLVSTWRMPQDRLGDLDHVARKPPRDRGRRARIGGELSSRRLRAFADRPSRSAAAPVRCSDVLPRPYARLLHIEVGEHAHQSRPDVDAVAPREAVEALKLGKYRRHDALLTVRTRTSVDADQPSGAALAER